MCKTKTGPYMETRAIEAYWMRDSVVECDLQRLWMMGGLR